MSSVESRMSGAKNSTEPATPFERGSDRVLKPRLRCSSETIQAGIVLLDVIGIMAVTAASGPIATLVSPSSRMDALDSAFLGSTLGVLFAAVFAARGDYRMEALRDRRGLLRRVGFAWMMAFFVLGWLTFLSKTSATMSRGVISTTFVIGLAVICIGHVFAARLLSRWLGDRLLSLRRAFVIGQCDGDARARLIERLGGQGVEVVDFFSVGAKDVDGSEFAAACRKAAQGVRAAIAKQAVDGIFLFMPWRDRRAIDELRAALCPTAVPVHLFADFETERLLNRPQLRLGSFRAVELERAPLSRIDRIQKRVLDITIAASALILLSPLLALTSVAILIESGWPILFVQKRNGFGGRPFKILKFRTMVVLENGSEIAQAKRDDSRVTRLGAVLRRTSIDELPQLINVLQGHMSICGPRPHAVAHDNFYDRVIATYAFRHHVKPGITGWAQVNRYRGETQDISQMEARVEHDLWYINNWSIWLDVRIIVRTIFEVLGHKNAY